MLYLLVVITKCQGLRAKRDFSIFVVLRC